MQGLGGGRDMESVKNKGRNVHKQQSNGISFYKIVKLKLDGVNMYGETSVCFTGGNVVCMPGIYIVYPQQFYKI